MFPIFNILVTSKYFRYILNLNSNISINKNIQKYNFGKVWKVYKGFINFDSPVHNKISFLVGMSIFKLNLLYIEGQFHRSIPKRYIFFDIFIFK